MGVYIKGMEMPESCAYCRFEGGGYCFAEGEKLLHVRIRDDVHSDCPLVPVPPHGRLIDADALLESIKEAKKKQPEISDVYDEDYFAVAEWVAYAPTIIESEGK